MVKKTLQKHDFLRDGPEIQYTIPFDVYSRVLGTRVDGNTNTTFTAFSVSDINYTSTPNQTFHEQGLIKLNTERCGLITWNGESWEELPNFEIHRRKPSLISRLRNIFRRTK
tara:strand:+ start:5270 stop:5605 length:336 start_codon:yes stop_codon:yes gene_type:complete